MKTAITDPTPAALRAALAILENPDLGQDDMVDAREIALVIDQETGFAELLGAASALSAAYLDAEPTKTKADAWTRLHAAIRSCK
jgi:hypothetical protein